MVDRTAFEADLRSRGYAEIVEGGMGPNKTRDAHRHDFEVRGMVIEGELRLGCDGKTMIYRAGDIFTMDADREHTESTGPAGFTSVVGRKRPTG